MIPIKTPICLTCKNLFKYKKWQCKAFEEIPNIILEGKSNHSKPLPGQKNKIVYEKGEPAGV